MYDAAVCELETRHQPAVVGHFVGGRVSWRAKRAMDILIAGGLLLALCPILLLVAAYIRVEYKGPALFRQRRGGLFGRPFVIYKFRTMRVMEDDDNIVQVCRGDPRVTLFGSFLRTTSIDELPQLINVLIGDMSLVGPRPHAVCHDREFQERIPAYHLRFAMRPGITGLAQVRGHRGQTCAHDCLEARIAADLEYIERWSLAGDLRLLLATLKVPLDKQAY